MAGDQDKEVLVSCKAEKQQWTSFRSRIEALV